MNENKSKRLNYTLFTEKYRPNHINDIILPDSMKNSFLEMVEKKEIPNMLFSSSSPGTGKTTTAKALCKDIGCDYIYINTSSKCGIDTLRSQIQKYAASLPLFSETENLKKVVILDEFDGATINLQQGLRAAIEEFHNTCRFISTCNYKTKIIEPLKSRCQIIDFDMMDIDIQKEMKPKVFKRLAGILKHEKIDYDKETLIKMVQTFYPDIRKMLVLLQQFSSSHGAIIEDIFKYSEISDELSCLILEKKYTKARKLIIESSYNYDELYTFLFRSLVPKLPKDIQGRCIIIISDYLHKNAFSIDKEITFAGCMMEIIDLMQEEE